MGTKFNGIFFPNKESREHALWHQEIFEDLLFKSKLLNYNTIPTKPQITHLDFSLWCGNLGVSSTPHCILGKNYIYKWEQSQVFNHPFEIILAVIFAESSLLVLFTLSLTCDNVHNVVIFWRSYNEMLSSLLMRKLLE